MIARVIVGSRHQSAGISGERMAVGVAARHEWRITDRVVVVDLDSLADTEVLAARDAVDRFGGVVIACAGAATRPALLWEVVAGTRVVNPAKVGGPVREALHARPVARASIRSWAASDFDRLTPRGRKILRALPGLRDLRCRSWASALGCRTRHLQRLATAELGHPPKCVLRCYVRRSAEDLRSSGVSLSSIASALGYASSSSLCTALAGPCRVPWCQRRSCPKL